MLMKHESLISSHAKLNLMLTIKKKVLSNLLGISREAHPYEVGGLLLGRGAVDDYVLVPGDFTEQSIYIYMDRIPLYPNLVGTFHSHPSPDPRPSRADMNLFSRMGKAHIIIGYPYELNSMRAYDSRGKAMELRVE
jgi:proteasome lid subunit RPN8/RPN11